MPARFLPAYLAATFAVQDVSGSEGEEGNGTDSETASPTIPALRASPFSQAVPPVPLQLARVASAAKTPLSSGRSEQPSQRAGEEPQHDGGGGAAVPRLNLSPSMHSNLETRNAVAELQVGGVLCSNQH